MSTTITKAVFPVAGYGTRFLPATKVSPKEMLPVVDKPLIQYATEEAIAAGIDTLIFVNGKHKRAIEDHYDSSPELDSRLKESSKDDLLQQINQIKPAGVTCANLRQEHADGLGGAILCAEKLIKDEPFVVLLADDFIMPSSEFNAIGSLIECYQKYQANILCAEDIAPQKTDQYGVVAGETIEEGILEVKQLVEKPKPAEAPSHIGIIGRYVLQADIFKYLKSIEKGAGGELQLTDAIKASMADGQLYANMCRGKRYDCGSKQGYLEANVEVGLKHPHTGESFRQYLKGKVKNL